MANFEWALAIFVVFCAIPRAVSSITASDQLDLRSDLNVRHFLERYICSQIAHLCPFTVTFFSSNGKLMQDFSIPAIINSAFFPIRVAHVGANVSNATWGGQSGNYRRRTNQCSTITAIVAKGSIQPKPLVKHLKSNGAPAQDYYLILSTEQFLQQMSSEFQAFRFLIAAAIDFSTIYFKSPQWPHHIFKTLSATPDFPKISKKPINLNGIHIRIAYVVVYPFLLKDSHGKLKGLTHSIYSTAAQHFNFTYEFVLPLEPCGGTGRQLPNGTWIGLLGELDAGRADLTMSASVTLERMREPFEFTEFYYLVGFSFVTAHPGLATVRWETLVKPFHNDTWFLTIVTFGSFSITMFVVLWVGRFSTPDSELINHIKLDTLFLVAVLLPIRLLLEQGSGKPIPSRGRVLVGLWMFLSLVLCTCYKDKLFGYVTFPQEEIIPQSMRELADRPDYTILLYYWPSAQYHTWETSAQPHFKSMLARAQRVNNPFSCVVRAAIEPKTVCFAHRFELMAAMSANLTYDTHFSPVFMTTERYFSAFNVLPMPKGSIFLDSWKWIASWYRDFDLPMKWCQEVTKTTAPRVWNG